MSKLAIFSTSLEAVHEQEIVSSSQKFELRFANGIAECFDNVCVISPTVKHEIAMGKVRFIPARRINKRIVDYYSACKEREITHALMYGYDPLCILQMLLLGTEVKKYAFIFDTHIGMSAFRKPIRRKLIDTYFQIGIALLNRLTGVILFKKTAYEDMRLRIPYVLTTVTANDIHSESENVRNGKAAEGYTVFYAGAITEYNCIGEICDAARMFSDENENVRFDIYGDGPSLAKIENHCSKNVFFHGRQENQTVVAAMQHADLVLNIRRTTDKVNIYSYPSKLIEYLENRKTILTTNVSENEPLSDVAYVIDDTDPVALHAAIKRIAASKNETIKKQQRIESYLNEYHNSRIEVEKVAGFLKETNK